MTRGEWLGLAAIVVAILAGSATVWAQRQWGTRRRKLLFTFDSAPLLPPGSEGGLLKVTYRDFPVNDPHLVTVRLRNVGPADITTQHFDSARPLTVRLNCVMYGLIAASGAARTVSGPIGSNGFVSFDPQLLRRGQEWVVEAVVSGDSSPTIDTPLIDTDIVEGPTILEQVADQLVGLTISLPFGVRLQVPR